VHPEALTSYSGLAELSAKLPPKVLEIKVNVRKAREKFQKALGREV
jgi:hypothetical protein